MKTPTLVLLLSLAANLALGGLVLSRRAPAIAAPAPAAESAPTPAGTTTDSPTTTAATKPASQSTNPADADYVARLRAGGMPPELIRDLVYFRVWARYRERQRALLPPGENRYWLGNSGWSFSSRWSAASPEARAKLRALDQEAAAEMRALLGDGPDALSTYERRLYDQMANYLPTSKIQQIEAIRKDYDELAARVREQSKGLVLKADREQLRLIEREFRADLAAALTPEELLEYDLRASPTAGGLRNRLAYFEPSEDEFRTLAKLQLELDQRFGTTNLSGKEQDLRKAAENDLKAKIQSVLPPDRYADYLVSIDGMFSETRYFTSAYNLAPSVAKEIVALKQRTWKRIDELDQAGVNAEQRAATLKALELEVEHQLTARLGADVFGKYQTGANWMKRLRPTPPRS